MKRKGFTLIELLAVIVILAIIAVIATPMVLNTIDDARKGAAKSSTYSYIEEVETEVAKYMLDNNGTRYASGKYDIAKLSTDLGVEVKGDAPSAGKIRIGSNGVVTKASLKINNYVISYNGKETVTTDLDEIEDITCDGASTDDTTDTDGEDKATVVNMQIGDYISMTPTSTSYSISGELTGYVDTSTGEYISQTINPSKLNLWRVISVNDDGTIDMVSEYVSSTNIYFYGKTGYLNFVGALNTIAKQYENSNYTVGSRYMGYNGQTETITDTSYFTETAPWSTSTVDNSNEAVGGGDILYKKDTELVATALGTLMAYKPGSTTLTSYWLASRYYCTYCVGNYSWLASVVSNDGVIIHPSVVLYYYDSRSKFSDNSSNKALRPIVTLKSGLTATGSGTSDSPWLLS